MAATRVHPSPDSYRLRLGNPRNIGWDRLNRQAVASLYPTSARPSRLNFRHIYWHGVRINEVIAWKPEKLTIKDVWDQQNLEVRRVMIDRMGYNRFFEEAGAEQLDIDEDAGGVRRLMRVKMPRLNRWERDEPVVCLAVTCPSTGRKYALRVPPNITSCHAGAAWLAGFDNPNDYAPIKET